MSLLTLRRRLPLVVFILLAGLCLVLVGLTCVCLSDHPLKAVERAVAAISASLPVAEIWAFVVALTALAVSVTRTRTTWGRSSPAVLQRFLF